MNFMSTVETALSTLNIPVKHLVYTGVKTVPYCIFHRYNVQGAQYTEGREKVTGHYIQVDIYGPSDVTDYGNTAEALMVAAGAIRIGGQSTYEDETKLFHDSRDYLFESA